MSSQGTTVYEYEPKGGRPSHVSTPPYALIRGLSNALPSHIAIQYYTRGEGFNLSLYLMFIKNGENQEWSTYDRRELEEILEKTVASYDHANTY
uniref:Uncharacterized protein n=1 Tax=Kwoniella bestiolae CBS 10118 TaxID=1296100 RepID=A0A1B9FSR7_9TREE|nr:hypothetical protein I302_08598 [Kwoniella bestiolae CBS 10118]OCF21819.1 hypothetical protein I302_08598 [Kwoniella bestiolae CBS 10118]